MHPFCDTLVLGCHRMMGVRSIVSQSAKEQGVTDSHAVTTGQIPIKPCLEYMSERLMLAARSRASILRPQPGVNFAHAKLTPCGRNYSNPHTAERIQSVYPRSLPRNLPLVHGNVPTSTAVAVLYSTHSTRKAKLGIGQNPSLHAGCDKS